MDERKARKLEVTLHVSVDPSWTDQEVIGEIMQIFDDSLYEDSEMWVKQVRLHEQA